MVLSQLPSFCFIFSQEPRFPLEQLLDEHLLSAEQVDFHLVRTIAFDFAKQPIIAMPFATVAFVAFATFIEVVAFA